ncbi:MAG: hypothetical protein EOO21_01410 [Comamonadaceae bacterium]|nr:MAG: hypothetical protein EOO21_01410 [Comamonadaceae bacterium]
MLDDILQDPAVLAAIQRSFPDAYFQVASNSFFVKAPGLTAKGVADRLGVKSKREDGMFAGTLENVVVTQLAPSYWGWAPSTIWEWLQVSHQGGS